MSFRLDVAQTACGLAGVNEIGSFTGSDAISTVCRNTVDAVIRQLMATHKMAFADELAVLTYVGQNGTTDMPAQFVAPPNLLQIHKIFDTVDESDTPLPYRLIGDFIYMALAAEDVDTETYSIDFASTGPAGTTDYKTPDPIFHMAVGLRIAAYLARAVVKNVVLYDSLMGEYKEILDESKFIQATTTRPHERILNRGKRIRQ